MYDFLVNFGFFCIMALVIVAYKTWVDYNRISAGYSTDETDMEGHKNA